MGVWAWCLPALALGIFTTNGAKAGEAYQPFLPKTSPVDRVLVVDVEKDKNSVNGV